jgi:transposase InsO family protein
MKANQATLPIATMARLLQISASGNYAWLPRSPSKRACSDADLLGRIRAIHASSRGTYGMPRIHAELVEHGVHVGRKRIARLMHIAGLCGVSRRRWINTTRRQPGARPAPDLVQRHFVADAPNRLSVADATYVPTVEALPDHHHFLFCWPPPAALGPRQYIHHFLIAVSQNTVVCLPAIESGRPRLDFQGAAPLRESHTASGGILVE